LRKIIVILMLVLLLLATAIGVYYNFVYLPEKRKQVLEERIKPLIDAGLTREKALEFDEIHRDWAPYNETATEYARYWVDYPVVSEAVLETSGSLKHTASSLDLVVPNIANKTLTEDTLIDFMVKHPSLVKDDGLNTTDMDLVKYYVHLPRIVDRVTEKIKSQEDRLFALNELAPYVSKPLTEEQAYHLIEKWYPDLFSACKKERVPVVFGDSDEDFVNNYDEIFEYGTDPLFGIGNFTWTPTKIVNDKVYEVSVFIRAKSLRGILPSKLYWIPINYTQFPLEVQLRAFPNETVREFDLIPVNENLIESHITIKDFKGGREYLVTANITDKTGNVITERKIPYIREFENLGKRLYEKGTKIGIVYGLITKQHEWDDYIELGGPYEPLLGYYVLNSTSTENLMVIERHMDWMSGHGINFILDIWSGKESEGDIRDRVFKEAISTLEMFKAGGMKFGILYESHWRFVDAFEGINMSDPRNIQILKEDLSYLKENYFGHPAYLKIEEKPFFHIYGNDGMYGNIISGLEEVYKFMKENYGIQLYMLSSHAIPEVNEDWRGPSEPRGIKVDNPSVKELAYLFDAMVTGGAPTPDYAEFGSYEDYLEMGYRYWYNFSLRNELDFIPLAIPGYSRKYCPWHSPEVREKDLGAVPRSIELWKERLIMSIPYSNTFGMMVGDWNDFTENARLEPSTQQGEGFEYLEAMKDILAEYYELGT